VSLNCLFFTKKKTTFNNTQCAVCTRQSPSMVGQKWGPLCCAVYNFRNIEQIFTKFATNQSLHSEHCAIIYLNQSVKIVAPSSE